jgi:Cu2+-exporting ATPase
MQSISTVQSAITHCYHCGLQVPSGAHYPVVIGGEERAMCCPGCQAVASAIVDGGLENFYRFRTQANERPAEQRARDVEQWKIYDLPEVQADFVIPLDEKRSQANLLLEGVTCAACSWLVENHLRKFPGVVSLSLNITSHRCKLVWQPGVQPLSELLQALADIGYRPRPATDEQAQELVKKENRMALFRLGVAGFAMMQATMVAVGMYTGASDAWLNFLRWQSFLAATPVVFFSCWPFFKAAWRSLQSRHLVMDVPVALAIGLAYIASGWATLFETGEVYFESVAMFAFFLLLGRYIEMRARHRNREAFGNLAQLMPLSACCLVEEGQSSREELRPVKLLKAGDLVLVRAGETFPADGRVESGESNAVEAIVTGESRPVPKVAGDKVIGGTLNVDSSLTVRVTATGAASQLSAIERLAAQAAEEKPVQVTQADALARFFIARLLLICVFVFGFWLWYQPERAFWVTLSVLVVTCPCALALAMPAALSAATARLRSLGFMVARGHVIEGLTRINRVIFDKTGTLTQGRFSLVETCLCRDLGEEQCLLLAAALEARANHPLAAAFAPWQEQRQVDDFRQHTGQGVEGSVNGRVYRLGSPAFVQSLTGGELLPLPDGERLWLLLGDELGPLAWFALADEVRPGAAELVAYLQSRDIAVELLSGDSSGAVALLAQQLGIRHFRAGATPDDKLSHLQAAQARGDKVIMLGDGINDVPVLSGADVSVAMASASDLAQTRADALLLNENLLVLADALELARRTRRTIRQNLGLSLTYNLLALPLAAAGWVLPWQAALGMTGSSLLVVFNSLRLSRYKGRL